MKVPITPPAIAPVWLLLFEMAAMDEGSTLEVWMSEIEVGVNDGDKDNVIEDDATDSVGDDDDISVDEVRLSTVMLANKELLEVLAAP